MAKMNLTLRGQIFIACLIAAGIGVIPIGWLFRPVPLSGNEFGTLVYLAAATQIAAIAPIRWGRGSHSVFTASLIAAGLSAPGPGVAMLCWVATYDGRLPFRDAPLWRLSANRANLALAHGVPSLVLALIPFDAWIPAPLALPLRTLLYSLAVTAINYPITAQIFAIMNRTRVLDELRENVAWPAIQSMLLLGMAGGALYLLLLAQPIPVGYVMGVALLSFLVLARTNLAYAQAQIQARVQTLQLVAHTLDARDPYTESHSERVAAMAVELGVVLGLRRSSIDELRTAGSLHDIGKIGIPDAILNKAGPLDISEWELMRGHPARGAHMIAAHSHLAPVVPIVRSHHERWNGAGYPDGLSGEDIPLGARILAVADSFDTITSPRVYRPSSLTNQEAVADISDKAGSWYDPQVAQALRIATGVDHPSSPQARGSWIVVRTNPRFARFLVGAIISAVGDPLTLVATLALLYGASRQPILVAAAYIARSLGTLVVGGISTAVVDSLDRRRLIFWVELLRGTTLIAAVLYGSFGFLPLLILMFLLGGASGIVQPARQAAVVALVDEDDLQAANATLASGLTVAGMIGYPLAGSLLLLGISPLFLFPLDGVTFFIAALSLVGLGALGGGIGRRPWWIGLTAGWQLRSARAHLAVAALSAFCVGMTLPTLVALGYLLSPRHGAAAYTLLELSLGAGVAVGGLIIGGMALQPPWKTSAGGLAIMGAGSLLIAVSRSLPAACLFLFAASLGNPVFVTGNQTALQTVAPNESRGGVMSIRFVLTQSAVLLGSAAGGAMLGLVGPRAGYAVIGLLLVFLSALAGLWLTRPSWSSAGQPEKGQQTVATSGAGAGGGSQEVAEDLAAVQLGLLTAEVRSGGVRGEADRRLQAQADRDRGGEPLGTDGQLGRDGQPDVGDQEADGADHRNGNRMADPVLIVGLLDVNEAVSGAPDRARNGRYEGATAGEDGHRVIAQGPGHQRDGQEGGDAADSVKDHSQNHSGKVSDGQR